MTNYRQNQKQHYISLRGDTVGIISSIYNSGYNIKRLFLGEQELKLAYLGEQIVFNEVIDDLNYVLYEFYKGKTISNTIEAPVKRAILKGNTGYRDIDTGEILETFEEGRNLELVSVKMPVLKTTGKNLCDNSKNKAIEINSTTGEEYAASRSNVVASDYIEIDPLKTYIASAVSSLELPSITFRYYNDKKEYIGFNKTNEAKYVRLRQTNQNGSLYPYDVSFQYEEGSVATEYEPYKSNILTTSEEVELRGIGKAKDDLNLLTGELTQRIEEITLNGNTDENFVIDKALTNTLRFRYITKSAGPSDVDKFCISDKLPSLEGYSLDTEHIYIDGGNIWIFINRDKLTSNSVGAIRTYFKTNPLIIQYRLATESIKTVDLTMVDQDEQTISKLNSFNGTTHVSTEVAENSVYPTIAIEVATE